MKAVVVRRFGGPDVLEIIDLPTPDPGAGQVRVRVAASAVNPIDLSTRSGRMTEAGLLASAPEIGLARLRGLRTVALASADDEELVRGLGAVEFVSREDRPAAAVRHAVPGGVDAVIDAAVLGIAAHDALRGGGTFVALIRPFAPPPIRGTHVVVQEVWADGARLAELSALVDARQLTLRVAATIPLAQAATAHERVEAGGLRGRVVLVA